jgi:hypothetical protein
MTAPILIGVLVGTAGWIALSRSRATIASTQALPAPVNDQAPDIGEPQQSVNYPNDRATVGTGTVYDATAGAGDNPVTPVVTDGMTIVVDPGPDGKGTSSGGSDPSTQHTAHIGANTGVVGAVDPSGPPKTGTTSDSKSARWVVAEHGTIEGLTKKQIAASHAQSGPLGGEIY